MPFWVFTILLCQRLQLALPGVAGLREESTLVGWDATGCGLRGWQAWQASEGVGEAEFVSLLV